MIILFSIIHLYVIEMLPCICYESRMHYSPVFGLTSSTNSLCGPDRVLNSMFSRWLDLPFSNICSSSIFYEMRWCFLGRNRLKTCVSHFVPSGWSSQSDCFYFLLILRRNVQIEGLTLCSKLSSETVKS